MTTVPIAIPRNSPAGRLVVNIDSAEDPDGKLPAGVFSYFKAYGAPDDASDKGLLFGCPCGCGEMNSVDFRFADGHRPSWNWDGNREAPTLTPSILIYQMNERGEKIGEHWHGFLTAGQWRSC